MHHYGESFTKAEVDKLKSVFTITMTNHVSGAKLVLTGPIHGVFESKEKVMNQTLADDLGRRLAHFLRQTLL